MNFYANRTLRFFIFLILVIHSEKTFCRTLNNVGSLPISPSEANRIISASCPNNSIDPTFNISSYNMCPFTVDVGPDITVCAGEDVFLTAINTADNPITYSWDNGETTQSISFLNIMNGGTYTVTVTDISGCTAKDDLIITVDPKPSGTPYTATECEILLGLARFDLLEIINVHFGSQAVTFYEDINLTIPILSLASYSSQSTIIYAVITLGNCSSDPIPITLEVVISDPSDYSLELIDGRPTCCDTIVISFPYPGDFLVDLERECDSGSGSGTAIYSSYLNDFINDFDDNDSTFTFIVCEHCTYTITGIRDFVTNCGVTFHNPLSVTTEVPAPPDISTFPGIGCPGKEIDLMYLIVLPEGATVTFHSRDPPTNLNALPSSVVSPLETTVYFANVNYNGCFYVVPIIVGVSYLPSFSTTIELCEIGPPIHLYSNVWPYTLYGDWSGPGVTDNTFDPTGLSGQVVLILDPTSPCYQPGVLTINLIPDVPYTLLTTELCASDDVFDLSTLIEPSFIAGSWSGSGVNGSSSLVPYGLEGLYTYEFVPYNMCVSPSNTTVNILPGPNPVIDSLIQVCKGDSTDLRNYVHNVSKDSLEFYLNTPFIAENSLPTSIVFINGNISYYVKVIDSMGCFELRELKIKAIPSGVIKLGRDTVCNYELLYDLHQLNDSLITTGVWTGVGVVNDTLDLSGLIGTQILTFTPENVCFPPDSTTITIASSPTVSGLNITCDPFTQTYIVEFDIIGGDTSTYTVNGMPTMGHFISANIPSQTNYSFTILDAYRCDSITIQGVKNCDCFTNAGTMNFANAPLKVCIPNSATAIFYNDAALENDDKLLFVLHDGSGPSLGNVYAYSDTPTFGLPIGGDKNLTYYISTIAGDSITVDSVDLNDDCLSVSAGIPVLFYEPEIEIASIQNVCIRDCVDVTFTLTGEPPFIFIVEYSNNNNVINLDTITTSNNGYLSSFCPSNIVGDVIVNILEFSDKNCNGIINNNPKLFTVNPLRNRIVDDILCASESIVINGVTYNASNPSGTEIIEVGLYGVCDSIIFIDLQVIPIDTLYYEDTLCDKQTVIINGTVYNSNNTSGLEIFIGGGQYGCDSVMVIDLTFNSTIEKTINQSICTGESILVNGVIYDATNPTGTEVIMPNDASQCDSIIYVNLTIVNPPTFALNETLCSGESLTVNGTIYDEGNLTGQEILLGASALGCDSIINVNLIFISPTTSTLRDTICMGESIVINGEQFNVSNTTGSQTIANGSTNGCDSIINISIHFNLPTAFMLRDTICPGDSIIINGELFDESNQTGSQTIANGSANGCDSIINISIHFNSPTTSSLRDTICAGESIVINGELFDESNTTGSQTVANGSANGCDSIVNVILSFYPITVDTLKISITKGDSISINGVLFNDSFIEGLTIDSTLTNQGCTKYTYVIINFSQDFIEASVIITNESCPDKNDGKVTITDVQGCTNYTIRLGNNLLVNPVFPLTIENLAPGKYTLLIEGDMNCSYSQSIDILPSTAAGFTLEQDEFLLFLGMSSILDIGIDPLPQSIQWSPADYLSCADCIEPSVLEIQEPIIYSIRLTDDGGCAFTYPVNVKLRKLVNEIEFPNIFSPNGDGRNDSWDVLFTDNEKLVSISIYDRWGNNVHAIKASLDQESLSWDGTLNGLGVVSGVYVYVAEILQNGSKLIMKSGDFTLIR